MNCKEINGNQYLTQDQIISSNNEQITFNFLVDLLLKSNDSFKYLFQSSFKHDQLTKENKR